MYSKVLTILFFIDFIAIFIISHNLFSLLHIFHLYQYLFVIKSLPTMQCHSWALTSAVHGQTLNLPADLSTRQVDHHRLMSEETFEDLLSGNATEEDADVHPGAWCIVKLE